MCNNICPIYDDQKCIDEDICINLEDQCRLFDGFEKKDNPFKNCLAEKYNLIHLCRKDLVIVNNTINLNDER
jgi:hypothetical protein